MQLDVPQPSEKKGLKYIDCPLYGDCLMRAAKHNWKIWSCDQCLNFRLQTIQKKMRRVLPYYNLLSEIYPEFKRKYEPVVNALDLEIWDVREFLKRIG